MRFCLLQEMVMVITVEKRQLLCHRNRGLPEDSRLALIRVFPTPKHWRGGVY